MTDAKINIDMDRPCHRCGEMGAAENNLCLRCITDYAVDWEKLVGQALAAGHTETHKLLTSHLPQIHRAYRMSEDQKLTIGISLDLAPSDEMPNTIVVRSKINFIESRVRDEKTTRVSAQEKLPL